MISDALGVSVQQLLTGEAGSAGEKDPVSIPPSLSKMADAHGLKHRTVLILAEVMAQIEDRCGKRDPIEPHEWYRIYHALQPIIEGGK